MTVDASTKRTTGHRVVAEPSHEEGADGRDHLLRADLGQRHLLIGDVIRVAGVALPDLVVQRLDEDLTDLAVDPFGRDLDQTRFIASHAP